MRNGVEVRSKKKYIAYQWDLTNKEQMEYLLEVSLSQAANGDLVSYSYNGVDTDSVRLQPYDWVFVNQHTHILDCIMSDQRFEKEFEEIASMTETPQNTTISTPQIEVTDRRVDVNDMAQWNFGFYKTCECGCSTPETYPTTTSNTPNKQATAHEAQESESSTANEDAEKLLEDDTDEHGEYMHRLTTALESLSPVRQAERDMYIDIQFQEGPIAEVGVNGCHIEDVIDLLIDRLQGFNKTTMRCRENSLAITALEEASTWLLRRRLTRVAQGVEGTYQPHE